MAARSRSQAADRRGDLLPRHRQGQPHGQVGWRDASRAVVGRLPRNGGGNIEHIYNNGVSSQVVFGLPDGEAGRRHQGQRRGQPDVAGGARSRWRSSSTTRGRSAADAQRRLALRPLSRLAARAGAAGGDGGSGARWPAETFAETGVLHLEPLRAAPAWFTTSRRWQDRAEGQLRLLLAQPRCRCRQPRQPEHDGKAGTYAWNDANGDRRWQPARRARRRSRSLEGAIGSIRTSRRPRSHEASVFSSVSSATRWASAPASSTRPKTT